MRLSWSEWIAVLILVALLTKGIITYPVVVGPLVFAVIGWIMIRIIRDRALLRARGYLVRRDGRDCVCYQELADGQLRKLIVYGELGTPHALYIPSDSKWHAEAPDWARNRKAEIVARLKKELGSQRYQFIEH